MDVYTKGARVLRGWGSEMSGISGSARFVRGYGWGWGW